MEVPHQYPYNPPLRLIPLSFAAGLVWMAGDWLPWGHVPDGFEFWHSLLGLIPIAFAILLGLRRILAEQHLLLDNDSMVLPLGVIRINTATIEYASIRRVWRHYTRYYGVLVAPGGDGSADL